MSGKTERKKYEKTKATFYLLDYKGIGNPDKE